MAMDSTRSPPNPGRLPLPRCQKAPVHVKGEHADAGEQQQADQIGEALGDDDGAVRAAGMPCDSRKSSALTASPACPGHSEGKAGQKDQEAVPAVTCRKPSTLR